MWRTGSDRGRRPVVPIRQREPARGAEHGRQLPRPAPASPAASPTGSAAASPSPAPRNYYPKGTIALANAGAGTNSSHFFIFYNDSSTLGPAYTIAGRVTKGLEIVETLAKGGAVDSTGADVEDGKPKTPIVIQTLVVGPPPAPATPTPTGGTGSPTPAAPHESDVEHHTMTSP